MATPIESLFEQLAQVRALNLPTRQEISAASAGHVWLGKKGDGSAWSLKKTGTDTFEIS